MTDTKTYRLHMVDIGMIGGWFMALFYPHYTHYDSMIVLSPLGMVSVIAFRDLPIVSWQVRVRIGRHLRWPMAPGCPAWHWQTGGAPGDGG